MTFYCGEDALVFEPAASHLATPFSLVTNGNAGQAPSPYNPKYLLLKMPYRFNTSYQLLARSSACVLCDWFLSLDLQRSRP